MHITLDKFEQYIDETILARGLSYFKNGHVQEPDLVSTGEYEFLVIGTEVYKVQISLHNGIITDHVCNCPYDMGPVCKHVVAAIFYLQQDELEILIEPDIKEKATRKKRKSSADQINELLEKITHDELKEFIRAKAKQDRALRNLFITSFAHLNDNESIDLYKNQVKAILLASTDHYGFVDWTASTAVGMAVNQLLVTAQQQMDAENYQSAFFISTAIMEQMTEALQFADDSNGEISGCVDCGFEFLHQLAELNNDEPLRNQILEYCLMAFDNKIFEGWDWHIGILSIAAHLVTSEEEAHRIFEQIESTPKSEYDREATESIKYEVLLKIKGEEEANKYLEHHITNSNLRRVAIKNAISQNNYAKANKIAQDGIEHDMKDKPGLAKEWYDWLLKIAQKQGDTEKIIEYARYLLIDNFRHEQDYYQILKEHVQPDVWKKFIEKVISDISNKGRWLDTYLINQIFIKEEWWDRLLSMVKKEPDLRNIEQYEEYLAKDYADEIVDMYATGIMNYMEHNLGRKHYQHACRYLRRMIKLGGREKANRIISILRNQYPKRRALLEELNNV